MEYVQETTEGLNFPLKVNRPRNNTPKYIIIASSIILIIVGSLFSKDSTSCYLINVYAFIFLFMGLVEVFSRLCKCFEEIRHIQSRHDNDIIQFLIYVFSCKSSSIIICVVSFFTLVISYLLMERNFLEIVFGGPIPSICLMISVLLLYREFNFEDGPLNESLNISKLNGMDYGSGMAHSYFHGFLKIILPNKGNGEKGFLEFLTDYEGAHNIQFGIHKFFILIPKSLHIPPRLDSDFSKSIELSKELERKVLDRSGVSKRKYGSPVYKIVTKAGPKQYVSVEYATPVKTLAEAMNHSSPSASRYKLHCYDLTLNFYLTLKQLLKEDKELDHLVEVIYYDDLNEDGTFRDVGGIILKRMFQILKKKT